jgi:hypothetical protein
MVTSPSVRTALVRSGHLGQDRAVPDTHDHGSHVSYDPSWTETWYWNAMDPEGRRVVWAHVSWLPAQGRGQHVVATVGPEGVRRSRADTNQPLKSDLLTVDIVEPWRCAHLECLELNVDIEWSTDQDAIDFGHLLHVGESLLDHYESSGSARGAVNGTDFDGLGFRDRSFGPRNVRRFGRHWAIGMIGIDEESFLTANVLWPDALTFDAPPGVTVGCLWRDNQPRVYDKGVIALRRRDASPASIRFPDGLTVDLNIADRFGETLFVLDPNSAPTGEVTDEPAYQLRDSYLTASSPQLGRLVGWYEEGTLWVN